VACMAHMYVYGTHVRVWRACACMARMCVCACVCGCAHMYACVRGACAWARAWPYVLYVHAHARVNINMITTGSSVLSVCIIPLATLQNVAKWNRNVSLLEHKVGYGQ